jgi:peroxiredoxin
VAIEAGNAELAQAIKSAVELDAPLNQRLAVIAEAVRRFRGAQAETLERLIARLRDQSAGALAPSIGEKLPGFILPDEAGRLVRLTDLLETGPLVVTFQRGHWCPYCRLTTLGIAEVQDEILALGARIVAIVPEQARYARLLRDFAHARFPVLSDIGNGYALSLNLTIWIGEDMERVMSGGGVDLPRYQGGAAWFLPIPATFVLTRDGIVSARYVDPDHRRRMEIDDLLEAVRAAR